MAQFNKNIHERQEKKCLLPVILEGYIADEIFGK